jgi:DNA-binding CsgD family transcriptional regulator
VLTLTSRAGRPGELAEELLPVELRALRRGVAMRKVLPHPSGFDSVVTGYSRTAAAYGVELRTTDDPGVDLTVVDGRVCVVVPAATSARAGGGYGLALRAPALTSLALTLFDLMWKLSEPLRSPDDDGDAAAAGPDAVTELERSLLRLLSLGAKDEAAARHLGVSVRTVRRMVADLMRRLDARSRFQAGILAAQRGWL